jgi:hypothetical protein
MRERNPVLAVILSLVTFGIYFIYWFYDTNSQFKRELEDGSHPGLRTLGLFVPFVNFVALYKHSTSCHESTDGHDWLLVFLAYLVFAPIAVFVVQKDINDAVNQ